MHWNSTSLYWFPVGHPPFMCRVAEPTFLRTSVSSHCRGCPKPQGQQRGNCNSSQFQMRTLRYSLRRVSPLDSVNGGTHNPKVGGSNPPPATKTFISSHSNHLFNTTSSLPSSLLGSAGAGVQSRDSHNCMKDRVLDSGCSGVTFGNFAQRCSTGDSSLLPICENYRSPWL